MKCKTRLINSDEIYFEFAFRNCKTSEFSTWSDESIWKPSRAIGFSTRLDLNFQFDYQRMWLFYYSSSCHIRSLKTDSPSHAKLCFRNFLHADVRSSAVFMIRVSRDGLRDDTKTQLRFSCLLENFCASPKVFDCFEVFTSKVRVILPFPLFRWCDRKFVSIKGAWTVLVTLKGGTWHD